MNRTTGVSDPVSDATVTGFRETLISDRLREAAITNGRRVFGDISDLLEMLGLTDPDPAPVQEAPKRSQADITPEQIIEMLNAGKTYADIAIARGIKVGTLRSIVARHRAGGEPATECQRGHDWTNPDNVRIRAGGGRTCRPCAQATDRARKQRTRIAAAGNETSEAA